MGVEVISGKVEISGGDATFQAIGQVDGVD